MRRRWIIATLLLAASPALAQMKHDHSQMMAGHLSAGPTEGGQSAFAAIAEIVAMLRADPKTDWSKVNIQALRDHLVDMDNVTLRSRVSTESTAGGAIFTVTGAGEVGPSVQRMALAHAPFLAEATGYSVDAKLLADGAQWRVTSTRPEDEAIIRALGFYGLLAIGAHHQPHHLAMARGEMMH
jgi:hypothetical protein